MTNPLLIPPEQRRKPDANRRYPVTFRPIIGRPIQMVDKETREVEYWKIAEVKSRGRFKVVFDPEASGHEEPKWRPEVGICMVLGQDPLTAQEIYQAKRRSFWAKPLRLVGKGAPAPNVPKVRITNLKKEG